MNDKVKSIPSVSVRYAQNGHATKPNELGMRTMQQRAYAKRGEQYLLIKSPPASGKSRALMFIALDKLHNQNIKKVIVCVPEKSIGSSFNDEKLTDYGFYYDWQIVPKWNLCNSAGLEDSKAKSVKAFLDSDDKILVCPHATFRNSVEDYGIEVFDDCMIAIDEFHHVSSNPDNRLGSQLTQFMTRDKVHIVAMTGSYFRGDAEAVMMPQDEARFDVITYTYYEQLNGYDYLKRLDIGYYFYSGSYLDQITDVLDTNLKTIIHIPNVNSRESTRRGKTTEVSEIMESLGTWQGIDAVTGFNLVKCPDGRILKIADLVDDGPDRHAKILSSLKDPAQKNNRDHVDMIIALGMAKEGFDWIWCEHALTVGYRSSLTEIIQIIGRATRDAKGKTYAKFTNLIAEPDASEEAVVDAINDTLKAIAASLLMEQVLAPKFNFTIKNPENKPIDGFDYGENGYDSNKSNVGFNERTGEFQIEIKGLCEPKSKEASRICQQDLNEVITAFVQDKHALERGLFDEETIPEELTQIRMGKIIRDKYPELDEGDQEAVRQHAIAALNLTQKAKEIINKEIANTEYQADKIGNTSLIDGIRKFAMDVRELNIDLIDRINPFGEAYSILAKSMSEESLKQIADIITGKRIKLTLEEARELAKRAVKFKQDYGRLPSLTSSDPWEARMAEGVAFITRMKKEAMNG